MKSCHQALLGIGLAASIVACSNDRPAQDANAGAAQVPREGAAVVGTAGAAAERDFINDQLEDGRAEIDLGKIASERATHPQVKAFAQMMVRDHQMAGDELRQVATSANIQLNATAEPDGDHQNAHEDLSKLSGAEFDRRYMDMMVREHEEMLDEVEKRAESENAQVKAWATKTLPKVRTHLERAKELQQTLEQGGAQKTQKSGSGGAKH